MRDPVTRSSTRRTLGERLRPVLVPAIDGLKMYPRTAATIALLVTVAFWVTLPLGLIARWQHGAVETSLPIATLAPTGEGGPNYFPASRIEQTGTRSFFIMVGSLGTATLLVALLSALALAATRAGQRTGETSVRRAVGASRKVLYAGLLLEAGALCAVAILLGFAGAGGGGLATSGWPDGTAATSVRVAMIIALLTTGPLILAMLLPVIFARKQVLGESTVRPVPLLLPTLQLGLSLIAMVAGGLLWQHAVRLLNGPAAVANAGVVYQIETNGSGSTSTLATGYAALLSQIHSDSGVSLSNAGATIGAGPTNRITTDCGNCYDGTIPAKYKRVTVTQQIVSADSFHALGVGVVAGRAFNAQDSVGAPRVAIVSRSLANDYFQYGQPLGRSIRIQDAPGVTQEADQWYEVVGIVDDRGSLALGGRLQPIRAVYLSALQRPPASAELLIRSGGSASPPEEVARAISRAIGVDGARVTRTTAGAMVARESRKMEWFVLRIGILGFAMLLMAAVGTASLMRSWLISLKPELGLRRAVGASNLQLVGLILRKAIVVAAIGTGFGFYFGPPIWDSLASTIRDIETWSLPLFAGLASLLFVSTIGGVLIPAFRVTRATPSDLLGSAEE